jgi:hypothetical protein
MVWGQEQELPRLAVTEFTSNVRTEKARADSLTVRNLVESQMVATGKYQIVTRAEIDQLLSNQQIAISSISSAENVKKLQLQNISYIVTGSVDAMDADYAVTVKILDVSTGQFSHSANDFMGGSSRELYTGVNTLVANFVKGMSSESGQVAQAGSQRPRSGVSAAGIGIEVSTVLGGALYFQDEEIAALWDNDTYTIPIERPGTYRIRMVFGNGGAITRNVTITSRGVVKAAFAPPRPPENVRVGNISANGIELNWNSAGQGLSYRIYSGTSNNPSSASLAGTAAGTSYRVSNLRSLTDYYFWVSAQEGTLEGVKGQAVTAKTIIAVGDTGPGGGIVFYANGGRGMEVSGILGEHNWNQAISVARNYKGGGYSDWRLPTKDELNLVYQNLRAKNIGNLGNNRYWSSSEDGNYTAWVQRFRDGTQGYSGKDPTYSVRAIRAF